MRRAIAPDARASVVEPSFFQTMGIPILRGRTFSEEEDGR